MSIDAEHIREAHGADILTVAQRCGAKLRRGTSEFTGPCPAGCARDDGFAVNVRKNIFICRPSGASGDAIAMVQHALGLGFADSIAFIAGDHRSRAAAPAPRQAIVSKPDDSAARILENVQRVVARLQPLRGTLGERYLRETRRIDTGLIADVLDDPHAVGWHPAVLFHEPGHQLHGQRLGCIIAVMTDAISAQPTGAISRTYISAEGRKVGKAKTLGSPAGIVRLSRDEDVLAGLHLAEGLETALAAMSIGLRPCWSTGSAALMAKFPVLGGIECLTLLVDNDQSGAGERAAREAEARWSAAGFEVRLLRSRTVGHDLNDELKVER
jgi:hypothetical protein